MTVSTVIHFNDNCANMLTPPKKIVNMVNITFAILSDQPSKTEPIHISTEPREDVANCSADSLMSEWFHYQRGGLDLEEKRENTVCQRVEFKCS